MFINSLLEVLKNVMTHSVAHFYFFHLIQLVRWYASFCKSVDIGSIPVRASIYVSRHLFV